MFVLLIGKRYWEDPERFNPDRFLPENVDKIVPFSYIPFGSGPHICVGKRMAVTEAKIMIASICRHFSVKLDKNHNIDEGVLIFNRPNADIKLYLNVRI